MRTWLDTVLTFTAWTLAFWIVLAIGVGVILGRTVRQRDRQIPARRVLTDIDVDVQFAELTGVTSPAPREFDRFRDGVA